MSADIPTAVRHIHWALAVAARETHKKTSLHHVGTERHISLIHLPEREGISKWRVYFLKKSWTASLGTICSLNV